MQAKKKGHLNILKCQNYLVPQVPRFVYPSVFSTTRALNRCNGDHIKIIVSNIRLILILLSIYHSESKDTENVLIVLYFVVISGSLFFVFYYKCSHRISLTCCILVQFFVRDENILFLNDGTLYTI